MFEEVGAIATCQKGTGEELGEGTEMRSQWGPHADLGLDP